MQAECFIVPNFIVPKFSKYFTIPVENPSLKL